MINWISILLLPFVILLVIEEMAQLLWRHYLNEKHDSQQTLVSKLFLHSRQTMNKFRKNPTH
jgi:hypothetical protein